jgi:activator of 2-hydroxyglutaryl-CoA dehydratase/predicted nucleotide-binding protein (sugar kinase/HSP70/actin superfamily)
VIHRQDDSPKPGADKGARAADPGRAGERFIGVDVGAETVKVVELLRTGTGLETGRRIAVEHGKEPQSAVMKALAGLDWPTITGAAATGRLSRVLNLEQIPVQAAQAAALKLLLPGCQATMLISIGSRGFSVLELHEDGRTVFRENSRCSQGTGNFLRQLAERFDLPVEEAGLLAASASKAAPLSGRCPVILKTDMTHLANKGEKKEEILAGLFDAVCDNVQSLIKPAMAPKLVLLAGGVSRAARVRLRFESYCERHSLKLADGSGDAALFVEATGAALEAARRRAAVPPLDGIAARIRRARFESAPPLHQGLERIRRMPPPACPTPQDGRRLILGFDAGSTGSKLVALDLRAGEPIWECYRSTGGDPVGAAKELAGSFLRDLGGNQQVVAAGVTGSGREIVGSLLATCFGPECVFILNEIAAHAAGALHYDPEVDTIFEIGGQDAKYVRLSAGQVCDAAMNEACSAGTGSFIEEQGRRLSSVRDVKHMSELALAAEGCASLGQHCSVFMAEIIDAAVSAGRPLPEIIAGVYDSVVQNYLNRVKGNRSIGRRIFCQGMPFASDALAAALANRTGCIVTIPPSPGTVGALGIALLAARELPQESLKPLDLRLLLAAEVISKDGFVCRSTTGCGGAGNRCRIERLTVALSREKRRFHWGGSCSLYDRGVGSKKLPEGTPDPFREREVLIQEVIARNRRDLPGRPRVAITDEFVLKGLFPFFATFVSELGFNLTVRTGADRQILRRGIEESNVPYCAPLQLYSGLIGELLETGPDYVLLPMLRDVPKVAGEANSTTCSLAQASGDLVRLNLRRRGNARMLIPVLDMGPEGLDSALFRKRCRELAISIGAGARTWKAAFSKALAAQREFERALVSIGEKAIKFAAEKQLTPVVVLGRAYTIYNNVLNSNVPNLLRELGALAIPVDCYGVGNEVPAFDEIYWGYSQMNLRAAHQIRRSPGIYSVFCSNYSCGPDSFNLHFYSHLMEHKPFAIIETDGHAGDAGTKTRLEAFLYCVETDKRAEASSSSRRDFNVLHDMGELGVTFDDVARDGRILLIPPMGPGTRIAAAVFRAEGMRAEALPVPDREAISIGRRYTSGKECLPAIVTLGTALQRIYAGQPEERYGLLMPRVSGPCRFGVYNLFDKLIFRRLGLQDRTWVVSPTDDDYFEGVSQGFALKICAGLLACDLLLAMLHHVRPIERVRGSASALYRHYFEDLTILLEETPAPPLVRAIASVHKDVFGLRELLARAGRDFRAAGDGNRDVPTVAVTGEIYVRCDPGTNDAFIERLERRGLRARLSPMSEWIEYADWCKWQNAMDGRLPLNGGWLSAKLETNLRLAIVKRLHDAVDRSLGWQPHISVEQSVETAAAYLSPKHHGEAILTIGSPLLMHKRREISGAICVAPLECLPNKVAESQLFHASAETGMLTASVYLNGDALDEGVLDNFVYEVKTRHASLATCGSQLSASIGIDRHGAHGE